VASPNSSIGGAFGAANPCDLCLQSGESKRQRWLKLSIISLRHYLATTRGAQHNLYSSFRTIGFKTHNGINNPLQSCSNGFDSFYGITLQIGWDISVMCMQNDFHQRLPPEPTTSRR
jgi:hypothetical protein